MFHNVHEVKPGWTLTFNRNGVRHEQYWKLESQPHELDFDTTAAGVRELLQDAVERQLVSDVPVCTFLSGGLDSSMISAFAADVFKQRGEKLHTLSVDYVDNDKHFKASDFQPNPDGPWIKRVSEYLETEHQYVVVDTPQLVDALKDAVTHRDLPGMADVDASLYLFSKEIKKEATVALSGECADEIFGGYPWFYREEMVNADTFPWSQRLAVCGGERADRHR